ncbi:hypothetical protein SBV1_950031 [Verrucomicrobia bacterium]|nr:hypothetical protein SBV1_950031 [Verrucomicrobiota bacterium]
MTSGLVLLKDFLPTVEHFNAGVTAKKWGFTLADYGGAADLELPRKRESLYD